MSDEFFTKWNANRADRLADAFPDYFDYTPPKRNIVWRIRNWWGALTLLRNTERLRRSWIKDIETWNRNYANEYEAEHGYPPVLHGPSPLLTGEPGPWKRYVPR